MIPFRLALYIVAFAFAFVGGCALVLMFAGWESIELLQRWSP